VHTRVAFDYVIVRVVPRVDREEFVNAGVILFCAERNYLAARVAIDRDRLLALAPELDLDLVTRHLESIPRICAGDPLAGPIARLSTRERFHWLAGPRSTVIQVSPVHSGLCVSPEDSLETVFSKMVG